MFQSHCAICTASSPEHRIHNVTDEHFTGMVTSFFQPHYEMLSRILTVSLHHFILLQHTEDKYLHSSVELRARNCSAADPTIATLNTLHTYYTHYGTYDLQCFMLRLPCTDGHFPPVCCLVLTQQIPAGHSSLLR